MLWEWIIFFLHNRRYSNLDENWLRFSIPGKRHDRSVGTWGPKASFREAVWSQWVDATLAQSFLVRVYEADFVRRRQFRHNKALFRF